MKNNSNDENIKDIKKDNKKFIYKFIIFLIILILTTALGIYFTIIYIDKNEENNEVNNNIIENELENEEDKKIPEDIKYAIKSYSETYNTNSIKVNKYYDTDGKISTEYVLDESKYKYQIQFLQIEGLKNKEIQNQVNLMLKKLSYDIKDKYVYATVTASFSNILSVQCYNDKGQINTLNIDLSTGENIPLEKVFVSSATINSYLVDGLYKTLAWDNLEVIDGEEIQNNMDNVDTSEYEDKFMRIINNYNKAKDNLKYSIYPSKVSVYGLVDEEILSSGIYEYTSVDISLIDHSDQVAIYKRYLTKESIFENDNLGQKNIVVLTGNALEEEYMTKITYGKIADNIFMEEILLNNFDENNGMQTCSEYIRKISDEQKELLKSQAYKNKGYFFQREYSIYYDRSNDYYIISTIAYQATCSISYFKNEAFKDYINLNAMPRADAGLRGFSDYMKDDFPNLEISEEKAKDYYIGKSGEFLGYTKEEAKNK